MAGIAVCTAMHLIVSSLLLLGVSCRLRRENADEDTLLLIKAVQDDQGFEEEDPSEAHALYYKRNASLYELNKEVLPWMFDIDMLLSEEQARHIFHENTGRSKRAATTDSSYYWNPKIPINYKIDASLQNSSILEVVMEGIEYWNDHTCLTFKKNSTGNNVLNFFSGSGCWSYVGKQNWASQDISIGYGCGTLGTVTHEMAHALGFYHQQSRSDRDYFVTVNYSNIAESLQYNFVKLTNLTETNLGFGYDYSSVMQYDGYAFAMDRNYPTIIANKPEYQASMGQREAPAFSDVLMVNTLYNCSNFCPKRPNCQNGGIVNPNNCSKCICPDFFTGDLCSNFEKGSAYNCSSSTQQAQTSWKVLNGSAGDSKDYNVSSTWMDCNWLIEAPKGYRIDVKFIGTPLCSDGCGYQSLEMNMGDFTMGGIEFCCPTNSTFTSTTNSLAIRAKTRWNQAKFSAQYRIHPVAMGCAAADN